MWGPHVHVARPPAPQLRQHINNANKGRNNSDALLLAHVVATQAASGACP